MSRPKHTPGPWECTKYPKVFSINAKTGRQIAIMTEHHGDCPMVPMSQFERSAQDKADAALIAVAPELLRELTNLVEFASATLGEIDSSNTGWYYQLMSAVSKAEKAIAKAEGRES